MLAERRVQIQFRNDETLSLTEDALFGKTPDLCFDETRCFRLDALAKTDLSAPHNHGGHFKWRISQFVFADLLSGAKSLLVREPCLLSDI